MIIAGDLLSWYTNNKLANIYCLFDVVEYIIHWMIMNALFDLSVLGVV